MYIVLHCVFPVFGNTPATLRENVEQVSEQVQVTASHKGAKVLDCD
jgi:hypothetical protein